MRQRDDRQGLDKAKITIGIPLLLSIIVVGTVLETSYLKISAFTGGLRYPQYDIIIFSILVAVFVTSQYFLLKFTDRKIEENDSLPQLNRIRKLVSLVNYGIAGILSISIITMLVESHYNILVMEIVVGLSFGTAFILLALLSYQFVTWYKIRPNKVVFLYLIAVATLCANTLFALVYLQLEFAEEPREVYHAISPVGALSSSETFFRSAYFITSVLSFIITWLATVFLLRNFSKKFGRFRYLVVLAIPLVYFLSQFQLVFLSLFDQFRAADPISFAVIYTIVFSATKPAGGILFGVAFWTIVRRLNHSAVRDYMIISAYGMLLLFTSSQPAGLVLLPYPPFGLPTISYYALSSYLVVLGIYSAAISVAQDADLRRSIRKSAAKISTMLEGIGESENQKELVKKADLLAAEIKDIQNKNKNLIEESGVHSSLQESDIKSYIQQVLEEVKNRPKKD